ncbi:MAG: AAA family ATPase [Candidatus Limnocylindria bacterium]
MSPRRSSAATRAQTRALADRASEVVEGLLGEVSAPATPHGKPAVVLLMGFPGVGKTHCARLLAARLRAAHVASDQLRSRLFVAASYADGENAALFGILDALVERLLAGGHRVIVDATHLRERTRASTLSLAARSGAPCAHVLVTAEEPEVLARLAERRVSRGEHDRSEADERVYLAMRERGFEPPAEYLELRNGPLLADEIDRVSRELEARWSAA